MLAGLVLTVLGAGGLLYLVFARARLARQRERERQMPWLEGAATSRKVLANLPMSVDVAIQTVASAAMLAAGIWLMVR
jgi:hypothetical protein